jgi:hypothetical protein
MHTDTSVSRSVTEIHLRRSVWGFPRRYELFHWRVATCGWVYGYLRATPSPAATRSMSTSTPRTAWWTGGPREGRAVDRARRALRLGRLDIPDRVDPFAAIIRCTADPAKAHKRTRSGKWSRLMRYAATYKPDAEPPDRFIKRKGGINASADRFSRRLGARSASD